jgi:cyclic pyranopterin phosphate synthase
MVGVGDKPVTERRARALGTLRMNAAAFSAMRRQGLAKGDALALARAAAITAAKRTAEWIPLCHVVPLEQIEVAIAFEPRTRTVRVEVEARARWKTGVEMEAMVGAAAALLTLYDMAKALDRGMRLGPVVLLEKSGGRSGPWRRSGARRTATGTAGRPRR